MKRDLKQYSKGLYTDSNELRQPENTYRWLLNGVLESIDGDYGDISNEKGNEPCADLPSGYTVIGSVLANNNDSILFLTNGTASIIGIHTTNCEYTTLLQTTCLNLRTDYPVDVVFRIRDGCERTVYFTDGYNPIYSVNLDALHTYVDRDLSDEIDADDDITDKATEKVTQANATDQWNCNLFKLFGDIQYPTIELNTITNTGGRLQSGSYRFSIRYLDQDLNPTNWLFITAPNIPIYFDSLGNTYDSIQGGFNGEGESTDGYNTLPPTNKSIVLDIGNLDISYSYYQLAVVEYVDGIGVPSNVYILNSKFIPSDATDVFIYGGINANDTTITSTTLDELITPRLVIDSAQHIAQINNRLILANGKGKKIDPAKFQQAVNDITSMYVVKKLKKNDINQASKSANYYWDYAGYMRDEIYAFALVPVFTDGTHGDAYHIPGPQKDTLDVSLGNAQSGNTEHPRPLALPNQWDSTPAPISTDAEGITLCYTDQDGLEDPITLDLELESEVTLDSDISNLVVFNMYINYNISGTTVSTGTLTYEDDNGTTFEATLGQNGTVEFNQLFEYDYSALATFEFSVVIIGTDGKTYQTSFNATSSENDPYSNSVSVSYIGADGLTSLERWEVYNTAYRIPSSGDAIYSRKGYLSYYECCEDYPNTLDCEGNRIYPKGRIRHHKFPDTTLEPHQDSNHIYSIGIEFDNINLPSEYDDIIAGYYIVRARRDAANKTIFDKGILDRAEAYKGDPEDSNDDAYYSYIRSDTALDNDGQNTLSDKIWVFHSPKGFFEREFFGGTHFKVERAYVENNVKREAPCKITDNDTLSIFTFDNRGSVTDIAINREISDSKYIDNALDKDEPRQAAILGGAVVKNELGSIHLHFNRLDDTLEYQVDDINYIYYASIKSYKSVYCNLEGLVYYNTHPNVQTGTKCTVFGGDTFISRLWWSLQDYDASRTFMTAYVESEINSELRNSGLSLEDTIYKGSYITDLNPLPNATEQEICEWLKRHEFDTEFEESGLDLKEWVFADPLFYNKDYNLYIEEKEYFPLTASYDYCKKCREEFPHRIWYSDRSFQEERADKYKVFLGLNYSDLVANHTEITNLIVDKDELYAHTDKNLWFIPTKPQQLRTTEDTLYVQSGDFLSIPAKQLITTEYGYGGSIDKWATNTTEFGSSFVDSDSGKIFLMREGLQEISQDGMRNWFENNLAVNLRSQWKKNTGSDYPFDSPYHKNGIGYTAVYDPRFRRLILHKRDYQILVDGDFTTDDEGNILVDGEKISISNKSEVRDLSWTMSYSFIHKAWVSYHSYMPHLMWNDKNTFYSIPLLLSEDDTSVAESTWVHNQGSMQTYYKTKYDFAIEYIYNPNPTIEKKFDSISFITRVNQWDNSTQDYIEIDNVTFDRMYAYTDDQMTLFNDIEVISNPYQTIMYDVGTSQIVRIDKYWNINHMRDYSANSNIQSLFTSNWSANTYNEYFNVDGNGNGYIDKIINPAKVNEDKNPYQLSRLKGKWLGTRLFFKPSADLKLVLQLSSVLNRISRR